MLELQQLNGLNSQELTYRAYQTTIKNPQTLICYVGFFMYIYIIFYIIKTKNNVKRTQ